MLIYRESRGKDIIRKRFLNQYKGKTLKSPVRINKDIINVSGATISVRGVNRGVRKMRAVIGEFFLKSNREPGSTPYNRAGFQVSEEEKRQIFTQARPSMGSVIEILITGTSENHAAKAFQEAFKEVDRLNKLFNKDLRKSKIYKINKKAWKKPIKCDKELFDVIKSSLHYSEITNGGFDITESAFSDKLNDTKEKLRNSKDLVPLINAGNYKNIVLDVDKKDVGTIFIQDKLTKLDLSPVVNGYVVDNVIEVLRNYDISHTLVSFGGTIRVLGNPPGDTSWRIVVSNPEDKEESIGFLKLSNKAVAISGEYEKMLINTRKEISDLAGLIQQRPFDPRLLEAVVVASSAFEADALSAAAYLSGMNKNVGLIGRMFDAEGIDIYAKSNSGIEIEISNNMSTFFIQKVEPISQQNTRPACAF